MNEYDYNVVLSGEITLFDLSLDKTFRRDNNQLKNFTVMAANNDDKKNNFWNGVKQGVGRACGFAVVAGVVGLCIAGPAGAITAAKAALGAGALGGGAGN